MSKVKMKKARWLGVAAASAVAVSALGAGSAQAVTCSGSSIQGKGSSLQRAAQGVWNPQFNVNALGCTSGSPLPTATYTVTSSGDGLKAWHAASTDPLLDTTQDFIGTDDAPTAAQITSMNSSVATGGSGASVLSIPVAQAAIAIVVNPPANCSIVSVTPAKLEDAFNGTDITTWSGLGATGTGCATSPNITRVVRTDSSGTSYQLKHFLFATDGHSMGGLTWADYQDPTRNTQWPGTVLQSKAGGTGAAGTGSGGGDEAKTVANTPGSIGYAALSDARSVYNTTTFPQYKWLNVGTIPVNPSSNGVTVTKAQSNCPTASSGSYGTLPAATASWSGVYQATSAGVYPICTLTWDLALTHYNPAFGTAGPGVADTVGHYLGYMVAQAGGQADALATANDYKVLPTDVRTAAIAAVGSIAP
jgi:ABC-type phosphate transport system substrate-binding protein